MQIIARATRFTIGRKALMALTGVTLFFWTVLHLGGNLLVFAGPETMNRYGSTLQGNPLIWVMRLALLALIVRHIQHALATWRQSRRASQRYRARTPRHATTWSARAMPWGGIAIATFVIYHLLHIYGPLHASFIPGDVFHNQVAGMQNRVAAAVYVVGTVAFCSHLRHGLFSAACTLGMRTGDGRRAKRWSLGVAAAIGAGYLAPVVAAQLGWVTLAHS